VGSGHRFSHCESPLGRVIKKAVECIGHPPAVGKLWLVYPRVATPRMPELSHIWEIKQVSPVQTGPAAPLRRHQ